MYKQNIIQGHNIIFFNNKKVGNDDIYYKMINFKYYARSVKEVKLEIVPFHL